MKRARVIAEQAWWAAATIASIPLMAAYGTADAIQAGRRQRKGRR